MEEQKKNNNLPFLYEVRQDAFSKAKWEEPYERFFGMIHLMLELNKTARKEGLFALEEAVGNLSPENVFYQDVQSAITFVVDGFDSEDVTELLTSRYFAKNLQGDDAMLYFLMISAVIRIQSGASQYLLECLLVSCLPDGVAEQYSVYKKQFPKEHKPTPKESLLASSPKFEEGGISIVKELLEKRIEDSDEKILKRAVRDVQKSDLAVSLKGLSISAKRKLFSVMPDSKADEYAEECEYMGPVRLIDVMAAMSEFIAVFEKRTKNMERGDFGDRFQQMDLFK